MSGGQGANKSRERPARLCQCKHLASPGSGPQGADLRTGAGAALSLGHAGRIPPLPGQSLWSFWNKPRTPGFANATSESVSHGLTMTLPNCTAKGCHTLCRQQHQGKTAEMR